MTQPEWYSLCVSACESQAHSCQRSGSVVYDSKIVIKNILHTWNSLRIRVCQPTHQIQYGQLYIKKVCVNEGLTFLRATDLFEGLVKPTEPSSEKCI